MLWEPATTIATPEPGDVHLYRAAVDHAIIPNLWGTLAADERARAERLIFERDRRRFVFARAGLRQLLGDCLRLAPAAVAIQTAERGKPFVADSDGLQFNMAHAQDQVLYALTRSGRVGVDIESLVPPRDFAIIAERYFADQERAALAAAPESDRWRTFLTFWTRKEAWVKATGEGVWDAFRSVDTAAPLAPDDAWTRCDFEPAPNHLAALAVEGTPLTLRGFDLTVRVWRGY
ncbi:MAG: 4'-phosphopantetheinyl transferase superfamily protein [Verrucomicrobia bacterium]|nr:4'-phosphopantetheinyl transferase superfamily protein [Verrucomicrobiota bacterium]